MDRVAFMDLYISTHTPREGRDAFGLDHPSEGMQISTHTPREGRDF